MANSDKDILITPNTGESANPKIEVTGADNATKTITINDDGTLSFDSTIAATSGSVADGNANLVTGDAVFDYIAAQNFVTSGSSNFAVGDITGQTALTSGLASTDELVLSDAGALKRMDVSVLQSYMQSNLTFTTNTNTQLTTEQVQDIVGAMFSSNTETRISATYEDGDGTIDLVVDDMTADTNTFRTVTAGGNTLGGSETLAFTAGSNVTITESGGAVTIASTDTNTQLTLLDEDNMSSNSATAAASQQSIKAYVDAEVSGLVDSAPSALNTLNELAAALGDDASFSTTTASSLGNRLRVDVSNQGLNSTQQGNALTNLGITASLAEINILDDGLAASDIPNLATSKITSGTFDDGRIAQSNVTQHLAVGSGGGIGLSGKTFSLDIDGMTDIGAALVDADLMIVDDGAGGTNRKATMSRLKTYMQNNLTFTTNTNTQLSNEQVQDIAGGMFSSNTETLITATYQDGDGTIDLVVDNDLSNYDNSSSGFITATLTTEQVQDIVGAMFTSNTETRISATYEDGDGTIDLVVDDMTADTNTQLSDEQVQDIVGAMFSSNTETRITATYQDGDGTVDLVVDNDLSNYDNSSSGFITSTLTTEQVQDIVGAMFSGNTETRVSATYQDGDGTIDLVVDDMTTDTNTNQLTTFTLTGDSGSNQTIAHGNTLDIAGGDGIATVVGSTDTVTVGLDIDGMTDIGAALVDADLMIVDDGAGGTNRKATMSRLKTYMQNNLTFTTNTDTTYSAGSGLDLSGTAFSVDVSDFMTNGSDNRIVTATGTDAMNAEANLTYDGTTLAVTASGTSTTLLLESTDAGAADAPILELYRNSASPANTDDLGQILWSGEKSDGSKYSITKMYGQINTVDNSDRLMINIASSGGSGLNNYEYMRFDGGVRDVIINEEGRDIDFRIEGDTMTDLFFTDASSDRIGIGTTSPAQLLHVDGIMQVDSIELGHASDTTIARSASGAITVEGTAVILAGDSPTFGTVTIGTDLIHDGDTNNKIAFGTDTQSFETGGTARFNISDSGLQIGSGARVTEIEDNDSLGTSDTKLATQGNIKAYVDASAVKETITDVTIGSGTSGTTTGIYFGANNEAGVVAGEVSSASTANDDYIELMNMDLDAITGASGLQTIELTVQIEDETNEEVESFKALVQATEKTVLGSTVRAVNFTEWAIIYDGAARIGTLAADYDSSDDTIRIRYQNKQGSTATLTATFYAITMQNNS